MKYVGVKTTGELRLRETDEVQTDKLYMAVEDTKVGASPIKPYQFVKWDGTKWVKVNNVELATTLDIKNIEDALAAAVDDLQDKIDEVTLDPSAVALGNVHLLDEATDFPADGCILIDSETNGPGEMSKDTLLELTAQNALAGNVAPAFDPTKPNDAGGYAYYKDEIVAYNGATYKFKVNHASGAWNAAQVDRYDLDNKLKLFVVTDNPDYLYAITDNAGVFLFGMKKDGSVDWQEGIPEPLKAALAEKVSKEYGKSLIDSIVSESNFSQASEEYLTLCISNSNQLISALTKDGFFQIYSPIQFYSDFKLGSAAAKGLSESLKESGYQLGASNSDVANPLAAFSEIVFVGDSLTASLVYTSGNSNRAAYKTYPKILAHKCGAEQTTFAFGGATAKTCWNTYKESFEAPSVNNALAIIYLGTNEGLTDTLATDAPVSDHYTDWADTNTGDYAKIVVRLQDLGYKILLVKPFTTGGSLETTKAVIGQVANRFSCACIDSIYNNEYKYHAWPNLGGNDFIHYNDLGYAWFASALVHQVSLLDSDSLKFIIP